MTIAEALKPGGYRCYMSGKWHVASSLEEPTDAWPMQRGFDEFYGTIIGAGSFYHPNTLTRGNENVDHEARNDAEFFYTDAISDEAVRQTRSHQAHHPDAPFFQYVAYTAPHWPLHAHEEDIARYKGRFDAGWDALRESRLARLVEMGIIDPAWKLTGRDPSQPPWEDARHKAWLLRCMEVYAAQVDRMDQGIGRILRALEDTGRFDDTLIIFLSDNGACAEDIPENVTAEQMVNELMLARSHTRDGEEVAFGNMPDLMPGAESTYQSYGVAWANMSNTPFRLYKHWTHEGGVSTPVIFHWPNGIGERGGLRHTPCQLPDVMATVVELAGVEYPERHDGHDIPTARGRKPRAGHRARRAAGTAAVLGARRQCRGTSRAMEAGEGVPGRLGALRHVRGPHGDERRRVRASGSGRGSRQALRRVGRALRRDPAGQGAGDDAQPAGQGVLGGRPGLGGSGARAARDRSGLIDSRRIEAGTKATADES